MSPLEQSLKNQLKNNAKNKNKTDLVASILNQELKDALDLLPRHVKAKYKSTSKRLERYVNILLSDLHFGADLDPNEVPYKYGRDEERRSLAYVAKEVLDYKPHYRNETGCIIHLAGDIIQGRLHDAAAGAPVADQMARAIYLLTHFIDLMSSNFKEVQVYCTPGNHGRNKSRHPERAVDQKWDSLETVIYKAVEIACKSRANVKFSIPKTPFYEYELFDMRGFVTHGDTVLNPGYPGRAINVGNLEKQILGMQNARGIYDLVAVGHVHVPTVTWLPSTVLLTNGCLIPPDSYATSIGLHANVRVQQLWETVPGFMFGDHRMIKLTEAVHENSSLDSLIPPEV